jgi:glycosyltransferase involved in cell wall biosynthesis
MKVSIIIPTKNNAGILEKCLKSIENLDYPKEELEVVIVDGHSEDGTVEIARKYGCRVVYESVGTIGGARNIGVQNSNGEFIVFTDADCVAERDWLKNLLKGIQDEGIASVEGSNITPEDDSEFGKCLENHLE